MSGKTFNLNNIVTGGLYVGHTEKISDVDLPVKEINAELLDIINDQPFREYDEDSLQELADSIKENGLLSPLVVNKKGERYEILAGRNRFNACRLLGWDKIPCKVLELDNAKANLILVDSNLNQRQELLPSEKAHAYKIKIESLSKINGISMSKAVEELANAENTRKRNIYSYLRLGKLPGKLLDLVDSGSVTIKAGLELVDFRYNELLVDYLTENNKSLNEKKAGDLLKLQNQVEITYDELNDFFNKKPEKQRKNVKVNFMRLAEILDSSITMTDRELEDYIIEAVNFYTRNQNY